METRTNLIDSCLALALGLVALVMVLMLTPAAGSAKDEIKPDRLSFYGRVESMPADLHGNWVIGGSRLTTDASTEFDQAAGPLQIGSCAKVDIRAGRVHEIDSEPKGKCR